MPCFQNSAVTMASLASAYAGCFRPGAPGIGREPRAFGEAKGGACQRPAGYLIAH